MKTLENILKCKGMSPDTRALWILWTDRKTKKYIPIQIKPELSLETKTTKWRLVCFGYTMRRQDALEKTLLLGKVDSSWKRGSPNMSCIGRTKTDTALNVQDLNGSVNNRMFWRSLIHRVTTIWRHLVYMCSPVSYTHLTLPTKA